jgi:hypothetical protein
MFKLFAELGEIILKTRDQIREVRVSTEVYTALVEADLLHTFEQELGDIREIRQSLLGISITVDPLILDDMYIVIYEDGLNSQQEVRRIS